MKKQIIVDNKVQSFYIRTLCSYEPFLDKGLPGKGLKFKPGDLLLVLNANDAEWWQAIHVKRNLFLQSTLQKMLQAGIDLTNVVTEHSANPMISKLVKSKERGLIPSVQRVQHKSRSKKRHVDFETRATVIGPTGKFLSEMISSSGGGNSSFDLKRIRKFNSTPRRIIRDGYASLDADCKSDSNSGHANFNPPYEIIEQRIIKQPRPVILIGPGKDNLYEYLLKQYPDQFIAPIPHTTRPARSNEQDGIDYHFVKNRSELEDNYIVNSSNNTNSSVSNFGTGAFHLSSNSVDNNHNSHSNNHHSNNNNTYIDIGKFKGHLYATSLQSIDTIIDNDRHPLLDVSHLAIERLRNLEIYPICILINTASLTQTKLLQQSSSAPSSHKTGNSSSSSSSSSTLDAQALREYTVKLEKDFSVLFDVIISPTSINEMRENIVQLIKTYQNSPTWVRCDNQSFS